MPFMGLYAMSKAALNALSDAMRRELNTFGIQVMTVEHGTVKTPIWQKYDLTQFAQSPFALQLRKLQHIMQSILKRSPQPEDVADKIQQIISKRRLPAKVLLTENNLAVRIIKALPLWFQDWLLERMLKSS